MCVCVYISIVRIKKKAGFFFPLDIWFCLCIISCSTRWSIQMSCFVRQKVQVYMYEREKHKVVTFETLETANIWHFCLKMTSQLSKQLAISYFVFD